MVDLVWSGIRISETLGGQVRGGVWGVCYLVLGF